MAEHSEHPVRTDQIGASLMRRDPLFLALTETWLYGHNEAEVHIEEYMIYRKDRPLRRAIDRVGM